MRFLFTAIICLSAASGAELCPSGIPLGQFRLVAVPPGGGEPLSVQSLNRLRAGSRVRYTPVKQTPKSKAEVGLLVAKADQSELVLLEPKKVTGAIEWTVPSDVLLAAIIWGPEGLDSGRIKKFGERERALISQLATYAEQTALTESLMQALSANNNRAGMETAVSSFATQYGVGGKLDRTAAPEQQMLTMLRSINPALSTYDPLAPEPNVRMQQSAMLAASVAGMFFGSTVGLGAGSAALLANMRTLMFPKLVFRSSFAQTLDAGNVALCGRREAREPRTKPAFVWAFRFSNAEVPSVAIAGDTVLPIGVKAPVPVSLARGNWQSVGRIREWALIDAEGKSQPVTARAGAANTIEIDTSAGSWEPGIYRVGGMLDWDPAEVAGTVELRRFPDLRVVKPDAQSNDALRTGSKKAQIRLSGADFRFLDGIAWKARNDKWAEPKALKFRREGTYLETELDLSEAPAGEYEFLLTQRNGKTDQAPFQVLPSPPRIEGLPLRINTGEKAQKTTLRGSGIDQISSVQSEGLEAAIDGSTLITTVPPGIAEGTLLPLTLVVKGYQNPIQIPDALQVAGPLPDIKSVRSATQDSGGIELRPSEIASGSVATFQVELQKPEANPSIEVRCASHSLRNIRLQVGETRAEARLRQAGDTLFLSVDPGSVGAPGCELMIAVESPNGMSAPHTVGKVVRLPRIQRLSLENEEAGEGLFFGSLEGQELELIAKVGWARDNGVTVQDLPQGSLSNQKLRIRMPWPSPAPKSPLYVWLQGESSGRRTEIRY